MCAYIGGWYVYTNEHELPGATQHAVALLGALITAFGGGTVYHVAMSVADSVDPAVAFAWGRFAWQQQPCLLAAAAGYALSVPLGLHPYDAVSIDAQLFGAMDAINWGILVGWATSKLFVASQAAACPPWRLALVAFPAGYAYCAAGGATRNLLFTAYFTPSVPLPPNLSPVVGLPMAGGFAVYALLLRLSESLDLAIAGIQLEMLLGLPLVAYLFYLAENANLGGWDADVALAGVEVGPVGLSGGSYRAIELLLTPWLAYVVVGLPGK